jgi:hypothetical protein
VCFGGKVVSRLGLSVSVGFEIGDPRRLNVAGHRLGYALVL